MKNILHGRPLLYTSIAIVCVYTALITLFTKGDAIGVFHNTYLLIPFHILVLYGIVRLVDYCLQKREVIIRSTVRILFTILLVLAQLPFVIRYIAKIMHNNEEVLTAMNTLKRDGLYSFDTEQILLYQLPWVVMLCVLFIKYIQPAPNKSQNKIYEDTTDVHAATSSNTTQIKSVQNIEPLTTTNNEDVARMIRLKTRRRLQTFGIFMLAFFAYVFAMIGGFGGRWNSDSGILIISAYGLFGWFAIRIVMDVFSFFKNALLRTPSSSFVQNSLPLVVPNSPNVTSASVMTEADVPDLTNYTHLLERGVSREEIIANTVGASMQTNPDEFFSFKTNPTDTSIKLKFISISILVMLITSILFKNIRPELFQYSYFFQVLSTSISGFCFVYGLYYLITSRSNKGLSVIIMLLPLLHYFILRML